MHFSFVCLNNLRVSGKYHLDWIKLSYKPKLLHACVSGQETKQIISENQIVKIRSGTQTVKIRPGNQIVNLHISIVQF
jgi:hypothetical protein